MSANQKRAVPEFMLTEKGQYGEFKFSAVLGIKYNHENPNNHTFLVQVQNTKTNYASKEEMSPELLRIKYKLGKTYKKGNLVKHWAKDKKTAFVINTSDNFNQEPIFTKLSKNNITHILGGNNFNSFTFGANFCYVYDTDEVQIVIPSSAVALYYYFKSSAMKSAVFKGNYETMYDAENSKLNDKNDANIVIKSNFSFLDGPFIYRFVTSNIAGKAFTDIFRYISNKKSKNDMDQKETDVIPIKMLFPIKESFVLHIRYEVLPELSSEGKQIYYVHEITNDESSFDFEKLTVSKIKRKKASEDNDDKKFVINGRRAKNTLNKTNNKTPSRKYATNYMKQIEDERNLGLRDKVINYGIIEEIDESEVTVQSEEDSNTVAISFAQSQNGGDENTRQAALESKESKEKKLIERPPNFDIFKTSIEFLENSGLVSDFEFDDGYDDIPHKLMDNGKLYSLCSIDNRAKQYTTCNFTYNDLNVVLVEVESESADFATWVLISKYEILEHQVYAILSKRYKNDGKIEDLKATYSDSNKLKFEIKKHVLVDENGDVNYEMLESWTFTLLGKIK
ncbi:MAG: hypothetical protein RBT59_05750 [Arcobacteraceae bacterium]|jgi:hypothetical protein|nr:hypothetical protein [Arcobacteraceae bacterium]